jgi:hypothetical protein
MSERYSDIARRVCSEDMRKFLYCFRNYRWNKWEEFQGLGFSSREDFKSFLEWYFSLSNLMRMGAVGGRIVDDVPPEEDSLEDSLDEESPESGVSEDGLYLDMPYYYDDRRDTYVVHLPNKKKPFAIGGSVWRSMVESYSNWDGAPSSVNEIARKFGLARKTIISLFKMMGLTHDSAIWSNEEVLQGKEDELVEDLLRRKEERVLVRAQRAAWRRVQKDADKYRSHELFAKSIAAHFQGLPRTPVRKISLYKKSGSYGLLISPTDFHWGKYAPEYTQDPYNRTIAKERLFTTTEELLGRFDTAPEKIFLAIGGDGLHIDNQLKTTTRGTPQDCDGTPEELVSSYVDLCREYISFVSQVADVEVYVIAGNHDYYTTTLLREALKGWFHNCNNISVVSSLSPRQTFLYGKSLITFMHGDSGSTKDWPAIIAGEDAELWGKSKWRFIFTGHLHTERELPTFGNVTVYRMPSLAGTDNWHHSKGYKSRKALIGYVVDKERGVVTTEIVPVGA